MTPTIRLTRQQVRLVDQLAVERFAIPSILLMENAARAVAQEARAMLAGPARAVLLVCGGGNNGGDGLAAARHLHIAGHHVTAALTVDPASYKADALVNWRIVAAMGLPIVAATADLIETFPADLIVDAVFGTGLTKPPRPPYPALLDAINQSGRKVIAVDLPSGLDCDTGRPLGSCVRASRTVTFVAEKVGFPHAAAWLGQVVVASIGAPPQAIEIAATG